MALLHLLGCIHCIFLISIGIEGRKDEPAPDPANYKINQTCEVQVITGTGQASGSPLTAYKDPCDRPHRRSFMHCNPLTKQCECYKDWSREADSNHIPIPDYAGNFSAGKEWFVYNSDAEECVVLPMKKCGKQGEKSPYRCQAPGKCTVYDEDVEEKTWFLCSFGWRNDAVSMLVLIGVIALYGIISNYCY